MTGMPPVQPRSREMEIVRVLFDRHLLDRAVHLAEARWAGSGEVVQLAYAWPELEPSERRQRLEEIGPQKLAQFRAFADLHPELAQVIDTLEAQGALAPESELVEVTPDSVSSEPVKPEPAVSDEGAGLPDPELSTGFEERDLAQAPELTETELPLLESVATDVVDLHEEITDFAVVAQERRAEQLATGAETLERVRARLDAAARRISPAPLLGSLSASQSGSRLTAPTHSTPVTASPAAEVGEGRFTPPPAYWLNRLREEQVVVADGRALPPSDDELVALANELGLGLAEFMLEPGTTRAVFGGLVRNGTVVEASAGPLPSALAGHMLVVVRGRLFAKQLERLRRGTCDIPGTKATVRLSPASKLVVIPQ